MLSYWHILTSFILSRLDFQQSDKFESLDWPNRMQHLLNWFNLNLFNLNLERGIDKSECMEI